MTARSLSFVTYGLPAAQGSKSFKGMTKDGHAILAESSKAVRPWRQDVVAAAVDAIDEAPGFVAFTGPVHLVIEFYMPRPSGDPRARRTVPAKAPDLSKLIRSTEDAMTTAGVWRDDALVVDMTIRKRYAVLEPALRLDHELSGIGARVTVFEVSADDTWADLPLASFAHDRFPSAAVPHEIAMLVDESGAPTADPIIIGSAMTDGQAVKAIEKAAKTVRPVAFEDPGRIASVPGKPLTSVQEALVFTGVRVIPHR